MSKRNRKVVFYGGGSFLAALFLGTKRNMEVEAAISPTAPAQGTSAPTSRAPQGTLNGSSHGGSPPPPSPSPSPSPSPGDVQAQTNTHCNNCDREPFDFGSTPFLTTWNGTIYEFENDFLFGKPDTAFGSYTAGQAAYTAGKTGSDTYILQNTLKVENGKVRLQIREIEPEESFIDRFELYALTVPEGHTPVVDGDLEHLRVFDEAAVALPTQSINLYREKQNTFHNAAHFKKESLSERGSSDMMLETGDEVLITIQPQDIAFDHEMYVYVNSHFRDWTLGSQVPFSALEQFMIKSAALTKQIPLIVAGAVVLTGFAGTQFDKLPAGLSEVVKTPVAYADKQGKCLFITAQIDGVQYPLQTLFPRFVQATSEVVQIPRELLERAKAAKKSITLRIKATKRHMVQSAFVFLGDDQSAAHTEKLTLQNATHNQAATDTTEYVHTITTKDGAYLHTYPGDVVDLIYQVPEAATGQRFFVLKADGFYTKLSYAYQWKYGNSWYKKLDAGSRKLLTRLKIRA